MAKVRMYSYVRRETDLALRAYQRANRQRFPTLSDALDHLVTRALQSTVTEGQEELVLPEIRRIVAEAVKESTEAAFARHFRLLGDRLAPLFVKTGKLAAATLHHTTDLFGATTGNPEAARRSHQEALLRGGSEFSRSALTAESNAKKGQ